MILLVLFGSVQATPLELLSCLRHLTFPVVTHENATYDQDRHCHNKEFDSYQPQYIAHPRNTQDVKDIMVCYSKFGAPPTQNIPLSIRSGGHSYEGFSLNQGGLVIDMANMNAMAYLNDKGLLTAGPGIRLGTLYSKLWADKKWVAVGGTCPNVALGGLALGGGVGFLVRKYGLTSDRVHEMQIVLYNGTAMATNATVHPDLFWALRGGGQNNFGVVTELTVEAIPQLGTAVTFKIKFTGLDFANPWYPAAIMYQILQWGPTLPNEFSGLQLFLRVDKTYGEEPSLAAPEMFVSGVYLGAEETLRNTLLSFMGSSAMKGLVDTRYTLSTTTGEFIDITREAVQQDSHFKSFNFFVNSEKKLSQDGCTQIAQGLFRNLTHRVGWAQFHLYGPNSVVNSVKSDMTAFFHRKSDWHLQVYSFVQRIQSGVPVQDPGKTESLRMFRSLISPLFAFASYVNYPDVWLSPQYREAYYGSNSARLAEVKKLYDPLNYFRYAQSI